MNSSDSDSELGLNENFSGHADNLTNSFDNIIEENAHSDFVTSSIIDEAIPCHREVHADKRIRKLPNGWKPSPEKIATAKENGFDLGPGETWVESY